MQGARKLSFQGKTLQTSQFKEEHLVSLILFPTKVQNDHLNSLFTVTEAIRETHLHQDEAQTNGSKPVNTVLNTMPRADSRQRKKS